MRVQGGLVWVWLAAAAASRDGRPRGANGTPTRAGIRGSARHTPGKWHCRRADAPESVPGDRVERRRTRGSSAAGSIDRIRRHSSLALDLHGGRPRFHLGRPSRPRNPAWSDGRRPSEASSRDPVVWARPQGNGHPLGTVWVPLRLFQLPAQNSSRMAPFALGDGLGRPLRDDSAALGAALGS